MSTVIIGGGSQARAAITALENASLAMTFPQRKNAEELLAAFTAQCNTFTANPQPPA